ncbi:MAG: hypothetical protein RIQ60_4197 [Pseudomonadota bacterium]|jgi:chromosome segregation ATPase
MSRGITEHDVCRAADDLLMQGLRPTIERVRQHIGRGSPNTVSPHLEGWFRRLGQRVQPQVQAVSTSAPGEGLPETIGAAARQFWQSALACARQEFADQARQVQDDAAAQVSQARTDAETATAAARQEIAAAHALAHDAARERDIMRRQFDQAQEHMATLRHDLATRSARLEDAHGALAAVDARLQSQEAREAVTVAGLRAQLTDALARADAADRRVALELDRERTLRAKAERRTAQLESQLERDRQAAARRLDEAQAQAQELLLSQQLAAQQRESRLVEQLDAAQAERAALRSQVEQLRQRVDDTSRATAVAQTEASMLRTELERWSALIPVERQAPSTSASPAQTHGAEPVPVEPDRISDGA